MTRSLTPDAKQKTREANARGLRPSDRYRVRPRAWRGLRPLVASRLCDRPAP